MIDSEQQEKTLQAIAIGSAIAVLWLSSLAFSLVASTSYSIPLAVALASQAGLFLLARPRFLRSGPIGRSFWAIFMLPVAVLLVDNLGRVLSSLGLPYFRILY